MKRLYHLVPVEEWDEAVRAGVYRPASLASEGFIHLSTAEQTPGTFERYYADRTDMWLVTLDEAALEAEVRWERASDGRGPYPHLYGPLDPSRVVSAEPWASGLS